jgi:hypothetical protein
MTPDLPGPSTLSPSDVGVAEVGSVAIGGENPALRFRYEAYRVQQGRDLVALLPREGLRALLREMHDAGAAFDFGSADGFEALAHRCADLLPLPPFEVWARDFAQNRAAYGGPDAPPLAPSRATEEAVTVAVAEFLSDRGEEWIASLEVRQLDLRWTGTVRFHRSTSAATCRTGPILRESDPESVRARFAGFDRTTLSALLRSALP